MVTPQLFQTLKGAMAECGVGNTPSLTHVMQMARPQPREDWRAPAQRIAPGSKDSGANESAVKSKALTGQGFVNPAGGRRPGAACRRRPCRACRKRRMQGDEEGCPQGSGFDSRHFHPLDSSIG